MDNIFRILLANLHYPISISSFVIAIIALRKNRIGKTEKPAASQTSNKWFFILTRTLMGFTVIATSLIFFFLAYNNSKSFSEGMQIGSILLDVQANRLLTIIGFVIALVSLIAILLNFDRERRIRKIEDKANLTISDIDEKFKLYEQESGSVIDNLKTTFQADYNSAIERIGKDLSISEELRMDSQLNYQLLISSLWDNELYFSLKANHLNTNLSANVDNKNIMMRIIEIYEQQTKVIKNSNVMKQTLNDRIISLSEQILSFELTNYEHSIITMKMGNAYKDNCIIYINTDKEKAKEYIQQAISCYENVLNHNYDSTPDSQCLNALGISYYWLYKATGDEDITLLNNAEKNLIYAISINADNATFYNNYGTILQNKSRNKNNDKHTELKLLDQASDQYKKASMLNPLYVNPVLNMGDVEMTKLGIDIQFTFHNTTKEKIEKFISENTITNIVLGKTKNTIALIQTHLERAIMINPLFINCYYKSIDKISYLLLVLISYLTNNNNLPATEKDQITDEIDKLRIQADNHLEQAAAIEEQNDNLLTSKNHYEILLEIYIARAQ